MTALDAITEPTVEPDEPVDDFEQEPDDVDACTLCKGTGDYTPAHSILAPRGELTVTCPRCGGSGDYTDHGPAWCA